MRIVFKRLLLVAVISSLFSGCTLMRLGSMMLEDRESVAEEVQPVDLPELLRAGWEFYIYEEDKVILIKYTETGMLMHDVFGVLNK